MLYVLQPFPNQSPLSFNLSPSSPPLFTSLLPFTHFCYHSLSFPHPHAHVLLLFWFLCLLLHLVSSLFFLWKHEKEGKVTDGRTEIMEGGEDTVFGICAYASLLIFWFVLYCESVSSSQSVCGCVCFCLLLSALVFDVTLGRPAGLKQQPAEAWRHFEPNIETCKATRQSHTICPSLPNKVRAMIFFFLKNKDKDRLRPCTHTKGNVFTCCPFLLIEM